MTTELAKAFTGGHNKSPASPEAQCPECGKHYLPRRRDQVNCSTACKNAGDNREALRAREVYRMLYHWILGSGKGHRGRLISDISARVRKWRDEDRAKGRPAPRLPEILLTRAMNARQILEAGRRDKDGAARSLLQELGWEPRQPASIGGDR